MKNRKTARLSRSIANLLLLASTHGASAAGLYSETAVSPTGTANTGTGEITLSSTAGLTTNSPLTYSNAGGTSITYAYASGAVPVPAANVNTTTTSITGNTANMTNGTALTYTANGAPIKAGYSFWNFPRNSVNLSNDTINMDTTDMYVGQTMTYNKNGGLALQYTVASSAYIPSPTTVRVSQCAGKTTGSCPSGVNTMKFTLTNDHGIQLKAGQHINLSGSGNDNQWFIFERVLALPSIVYATNVTNTSFRVAATPGGQALFLATTGNDNQTFSYTANPPLPATVYPLGNTNPFAIALTAGGTALTLTNAGNAAQTFSYFPLIDVYPLDGGYTGSSMRETLHTQ